MSPSEADKMRLLEQGGFRYDFNREVYFNRASRKVFSLEAIEDHDKEWLREKIHEEKRGEDRWLFYFNSPPAEAVEKELLAELDL